MQGKWTKLYHEYFEKAKSSLADELKLSLKNSLYITDNEVIYQFTDIVDKRFSQLFRNTTSARPIRTSWFKSRILEKYKEDKSNYKEGFQIDGFLEFNLPEIQKEFNTHYERADERSKEEVYFDKEFSTSSNNMEIIKLLASYDAYRYFFDNKYKLKDQLLKLIEQEKELVEVNHFNGLRPVAILNFMLQLTQTNPENGQPFLAEKQVHDLSNMICNNKPVTQFIKLNITPNQRKYVVRFFYEFYKFCNTTDQRANREEFIALMKTYLEPFASDPNFVIHQKSFARAYPNSPIKMEEKYKVRKGAN